MAWEGDSQRAQLQVVEGNSRSLTSQRGPFTPQLCSCVGKLRHTSSRLPPARRDAGTRGRGTEREF